MEQATQLELLVNNPVNESINQINDINPETLLILKEELEEQENPCDICTFRDAPKDSKVEMTDHNGYTVYMNLDLYCHHFCKR